ncbi:MAG: general secretion pathway protein F [Parasphingorhabdus sp.]|jgi:general secretion pathway protein F
MGAYEYRALDERGRQKKGVASGDTARQIRNQLREQNLTPLDIKPVTEVSGINKQKVSVRKINAMQLAVMTRQFATLLGSGMTVEDSLGALIDQSETHQIKSLLSSIRSSLLEGRTLADCMRQFPRAFPEIYTASVAAGEQTGKLAEVLDRLAEFTEARQGLKQRLGVALVYPIILTVVAILIVVGLLTYVVPQVVRVFEDTGQELPLLTELLISLSDFIRINGGIIAAVILAAVIFFSTLFRQPGPKVWLHGRFIQSTISRRLVRGLNTSRMARTLSIMVGSGVPLLDAMQSSSEVVSNLVMRSAVVQAAVEVQEGVTLSRAIGRSKLFPPLFTQMVASGEQSGKLDDMLEKSATALEREIEARLSVLVGLFEPLMILFMGGVVLTIVLAILLPIFDLNQLVR